MAKTKEYPLKPYIGVDCSGQPKTPPLITVATRWSRRNKQNRWVVRIKKDRLKMYSKTYRDWQEKVYAAVFFKVINKILVPNYEIHICKELPTGKSREKVLKYLEGLFGLINSGEVEIEKPKISFRTVKTSEYVREADVKCTLTRKGNLIIDERSANLDWLMKLLGN